MLPFSGVLGFWICWYAVFLALYIVMAGLQWDRLVVRDRLASVALGTGGVLGFFIVVDQVGYTFVKGFSAVSARELLHPAHGLRGPDQPMRSAASCTRLVGSVEQLGLATLFAVPLGVTAALFLAEVGGGMAAAGAHDRRRHDRAARHRRRACSSTLSLVLSLGLPESGFAAALALAVTMLPT